MTKEFKQLLELFTGEELEILKLFIEMLILKRRE